MLDVVRIGNVYDNVTVTYNITSNGKLTSHYIRKICDHFNYHMRTYVYY